MISKPSRSKMNEGRENIEHGLTNLRSTESEGKIRVSPSNPISQFPVDSRDRCIGQTEREHKHQSTLRKNRSLFQLKGEMFSRALSLSGSATILLLEEDPTTPPENLLNKYLTASTNPTPNRNFRPQPHPPPPPS